MATTLARPKRKKNNDPVVVEAYDIAADAKKRISLRKARSKYFHVSALSNGSYYLEPRTLVPMNIRVEKIEAVEPPGHLKKLMEQFGQALDKLP